VTQQDTHIVARALCDPRSQSRERPGSSDRWPPLQPIQLVLL